MASIRSKILAALAALFFVAPALAQPAGSPGGGGSVIRDFSGAVQTIIGAYTGMTPGSVITRPANTTPYGTNQTICGATSGTVCAPGTISIAGQQGGSGVFNGRLTAKRVTLLKSGSTVTGANFTMWFFSAAPGTATPNQFDGTSYTGPRSADMPNYLGNAQCANPAATSDTSAGVWYECTLSPSTNGALILQAVLGTRVVYYLITVASGSTYTPASLETFSPFMGSVY